MRRNLHFFGPALSAPSCRMTLFYVLGRSMLVRERAVHLTPDDPVALAFQSADDPDQMAEVVTGLPSPVLAALLRSLFHEDGATAEVTEEGFRGKARKTRGLSVRSDYAAK